jgi:type II secretory ATPase GspE/PulE/Tfp pilus assembly ATPase PilB-like protein
MRTSSAQGRCPASGGKSTGPTGSGKTSTLYASLGLRIDPTINVVTLEDPVEGELAGVNRCRSTSAPA